MKDRLRILCVDDEDTCQLLTLLLGISSIEVKSAQTIAAAWHLAQTEAFDLYLLETKLSDGNGFDLCRRLREYAPHTPILIFSSAAFENDKKNGLAAGANDYLTKPYLGNLAETIRESIEQIKNPVLQIKTISVQHRQN